MRRPPRPLRPAAPRHRAAHQRRGPGARLRAHARPASPTGASRPARACASTAAWRRGRVSRDYDPLLAKLLVVAPDRAAALARARRAHRRAGDRRHPDDAAVPRLAARAHAFRRGPAATDLVDRDWDPAPLRAAAARPRRGSSWRGTPGTPPRPGHGRRRPLAGRSPADAPSDGRHGVARGRATRGHGALAVNARIACHRACASASATTPT